MLAATQALQWPLRTGPQAHLPSGILCQISCPSTHGPFSQDHTASLLMPTSWNICKSLWAPGPPPTPTPWSSSPLQPVRRVIAKDEKQFTMQGIKDRERRERGSQKTLDRQSKEEGEEQGVWIHRSGINTCLRYILTTSWEASPKGQRGLPCTVKSNQFTTLHFSSADDPKSCMYAEPKAQESSQRTQAVSQSVTEVWDLTG